MQKRKIYTREFKVEAVRLLEKGDRPAAEIARQLGVARNKLYKWKEEVAAFGQQAFPGRGRPTSDKDAEIARLKSELDRVTEERDILKKAALYFARESR
jgi:transposase